ncbi:substrate-binding domain-containing protein [Streptomyces himalayensis]|uniref:DeoR/GlpR family transcriptional regulator n=1 Tax=Streptomyces himalayensis subsp. himalayensis TaxID=2756131 RepID=A0A7W0DJ45_9ACTN|nr:substrate-binding domain-containing protein [Streptomyces himalayensis]MBA2945895.1 DeoR/GlpR family transcriptional regulator [Streptomyces himalayensis subsp. himalayensis]
MHAAQRQDAILQLLRRYGSVRVTALAERFKVAQLTIRRDIALLHERGDLVRVHGGAVLPRPGDDAPAGAAEPAAPRPGKQRAIGMLVPAATLYFHELIRGAQAAAAAHHVRLVVGVSRHDQQEDLIQAERLLDAGAEGLLLTPSAAAPVPAWAPTLPVPVVFVERRQPVDVDLIEYVASDHELGAVQALRHLAELGHRKIAVITQTTPTSALIHRGYQMVADAIGLDKDVPRVDMFSMDGLDDVLEEALSAGVTAVLAHSDDVAIAVQQRLLSRGLAVPDDVALVAYDDVFAALADIPITAVSPPRRAIARTGVEMLLRRMRAGDGPIKRHVHLMPTLRVRTSTMGERAPLPAPEREEA